MRNSTRLVVLGSRTRWTPAALGSSLALWLDADDASTITLNGSTVSEWRDKSGNARHVSQATVANQPTYTLNGMNGKSILTFNGSNWLFNPTDSNILQNVAGGSLVTVANYTNNVVQRGAAVVINSQTTGRIFNFLNTAGNLAALTRQVDTDSATIAISPTTYTNGTNVIQVNVANYVGNLLSQFVNGSAAGTNTFPSGGRNSDNIPAPTLVIGATSSDDGVSTSNNMLGLISEVVITSGSALSGTDRQRLEGYLAWKWGLVANLPSNHPFRFTPPLA